jgi:Ion channel
MTQASPARRSARRGGRGRTGTSDSGGRYGLLLLVLMSTYLFSAFNGRTLAVDLQLGLFTAVLVLALRTSPLPGRWPALIGAIGLLGSAAALGAALTGTEAGNGVADLWKALMLLLTAVLIVRRVLARPVVTIQSIYGALSAYIIVGLMFAASYAAIQRLGGPPFFAAGQPATTQTFQYFSFTTLTTLGYGDFTALGDVGRAVAVMEALTGQVFLATLVARLVAAYRAPAEEQAKPGVRRRWPPRTVRTRDIRSGAGSQVRSRFSRAPALTGTNAVYSSRYRKLEAASQQKRTSPR